MDVNIQSIVIFGASSGAAKVAQMMKNIGIEIDFFVDNDSKKHGKTFEGKNIKSPYVLANSKVDYTIIIASMYHGEIETQLIQMGIRKENIVLKEKFLIDYIDKHIEDLVKSSPCLYEHSSQDNILIDLGEGIILGGIERWGIDLANALYDRNINVSILTKRDPNEIPVDISCKVKYFDLGYINYIEVIKELVQEIIKQLPCTIIINRINHIYMAAYIVSKYFKNEINIISILHSDFIRMYEQHQLVQNDVDAIMCVSNDLKTILIKEYNILSDRIYFKDNPVKYEDNYSKEYSDIGDPVIIGYGGRLEKAQKRADLLIPLIQKLEEKGINYRLNIAGDGSLYNCISDYVNQNSLIHKVRLFGLIPFNEMNEFWKKCDIFINLSDLEGIGLSMLEAMSLGVVPVVTDTAGAKSFITNGVNGYVNNLGNIDGVVDCIFSLSEDRNMLKKLGTLSAKIVKNRCNMDNYLDYLISII